MLEGLRFREYRLLWAGFVFMAMGFAMDQVARGWLIYELTNSPVQLGLVRGVQAIPILFLSPIAGSMADRYSRKILSLVGLAVEGLMYAVLAVLIISGSIQPWHVYVTSFGAAVVQTFQHPAGLSMIADAVPKQNLTNAIALSSVAFSVSRSIAPALAGYLIAKFGTGGSYVVQAVLYLLAVCMTLFLRIGRGSPAGFQGQAKKEAFSQSIVTGWRFSWRNDKVRAGLLVVMLASLFITPFTTLLPVFARDILRVGVTGQGLLLTGMGLGTLCGAVFIASFGDRLPRGMLMLVGSAMYGINIVGFAVSPWFKLTFTLMVFSGLLHASSQTLVQTIVQTYSPSEYRGRVMAVFVQHRVMITVGSMLLGFMASLWGAQWTLVLMGVAGTGAVLLISVILRSAWQIR